MESWSLFKDWTPEMLEGLKTLGKGAGNCRTKSGTESFSEAMRDHWAGLSKEARERQLRGFYSSENKGRNAGSNSRKFWESLAPEERRVRLSNLKWHSDEANKRAAETRSMRVSEIGASISASLRKYFTGLTEEERVRKNAKSGEGVRAYLSTLTTEQKLEWMGRSLWSTKPSTPTGPEVWLGVYLDRRYSGKWIYNGDGSQGVVLGGKIPDFVNANGWKAVIEVFGAYWHPEEEEVERVGGYKQLGYNCLVIWEYDCYLWYELDKILPEFMSKLEIQGGTLPNG